MKGPQEDVTRLLQSITLALFHVFTEELQACRRETRRHPGLDHAESLRAEIHDDNKYFVVEKMSTTICHGSSNMQLRARAVDLEMEIDSFPVDEMTIHASIPFDKE